MNRHYITTPIYYVNDVPHLGTSYTTIAADALRRYHALRGETVRMLTGTDEHGLKLEREARDRGVAPTQFVDEMSARFRATWPQLEIEPDDFIRTTEARHIAGASAFWQRIKERNPDDIYLGHYEGWYCVGCEELKTEKELEQPGNVCPLHKRPVERVKEPSYFFKLSRFEQTLLDHYDRHPSFVQPETRRNEVASFVAGGLRDLSISRTSFNWGIPVPGDRKHVMYVWFDALTNYWTALQGSEEQRKFWSDDSEIVHLVGKDILRFHAVYWPAILMSAGLPLPTTIFAHGFLTYAGQKMSKSLRNAVDPLAIAREFGRATQGETAVRPAGEADDSHRSGAEVVRYQLLRAVSFGQDGDFDLAAMVERYNADLGKNLGNLLARTLGLCSKLSDSKVPSDPIDGSFEREFARVSEADLAWRHFEPHRALAETIALCTAANVYVDRTAPWAEAKAGNTARVGTILRTLLGVLERVSVMIWPVLPTKSAEMRRQLGLDPVEPSVGRDLWPFSSTGPSPGRSLAPGSSLFPTIDEEGTRSLLETLTPRVEPAPAPPPTTPSFSVAPPSSNRDAAAGPVSIASPLSITYDVFASVDLRVGLVLGCEKVPKKDKLLKLAVDLGEAVPRTIVAGLALSFQPEALVGRKVIVVANLAPREFGKGLVSHGMLLASGPSENLVLASVDGDLAPGARLK
jgi:methionyl-tRNA synthetase